MKKILTVCLTLLAIFCFAACEKGGANASNSSLEVEQNTADFFVQYHSRRSGARNGIDCFLMNVGWLKLTSKSLNRTMFGLGILLFGNLYGSLRAVWLVCFQCNARRSNTSNFSFPKMLEMLLEICYN